MVADELVQDLAIGPAWPVLRRRHGPACGKARARQPIATGSDRSPSPPERIAGSALLSTAAVTDSATAWRLVAAYVSAL
jgi:hypothetical protein